MKVLAYGFGESEIAEFRMHRPMRTLAELQLAEVRPSGGASFPALRPREGKDGVTLEEAQANERVTREDAAWADVFFSQRYVHSDRVRGLREIIDAADLPHVLDIDDHVLAMDPEKNVAGVYAAKTPEQWGDAREIKDLSEKQPGERVLRHSKTGQMMAVKPKIDYTRLLTEGQVMGADGLITGTKELAYIYGKMRKREYNKPHVYYIPYCVDSKRWADLPQPPDHGDEVWVGWLGADEHEKDLFSIIPAVQHLLAEYKNTRFFWKRANVMALNQLAAQYPGRVVCFNKWVEHDEWPAYCSQSGFDIMLAPLVATPFNQCRSPIKWVEAAMLKTPCICSRTKGYEEAVKNRKTGFLCSRKNQWISALDELVRSKARRQSMGQAAHEAAMQTHDIRQNAHLYVEAFQEVVATGIRRAA